MVKFILKILKCLRCGHEWTPRKPEVRQCPRCKSAYWNVAPAKGGHHAK